MKTKFNGILTLLLAFTVHFAFAQKTVSGTVSDSSGPLPGVSVLIKGTNTGVETNFEGKYTLQANEGDVLQYSFIGMETTERTVGAENSINVVMTVSSENILDEVVVTALGIKREKKSLGYATQQVSSEDIGTAKEGSFISSLSGKVSGVQIKKPGQMGGSANIIIRGVNSVSQSNQALFVVDGVPVNNNIANTRDASTNRGGYDFGNAASDIDPESIESISVLKGAAASALYGSDAANGVILITTKKGKSGKGLGVTLSQSLSLSEYDKDTYPDYQREYGAGYGPYYGTTGFYDEADVDGDGVDDYMVPFGEDASFGAPLDGTLVYQWNSLYPELDTYMQQTPYLPVEHGPEYIFKTGFSSITNIAVDGGNEKGSFRLGYTYDDKSGILPNSTMKNHTIDFNSGYNLSDKFSVEAKLTYSDRGAKGRYGTGYDDGNIFQSFRQWYQVAVDLKDQKDAYFSTLNNITWNANAYNDTDPHYFDNPYWVLHENYETDERNRIFSKLQATYEFTDYLNILGRLGVDSYSDLQEERTAVGSLELSKYSKYQRTFEQYSSDVILNLDTNITDNIDIRALLGVGLQQARNKSTFAMTNGGLILPRIYSLDNSFSLLQPPTEDDQTRKKSSAYSQASLSFYNQLFLEGSYRVDKTSTLPTDKDTYGYPAASVSYLFSELIETDWLNLGKIRAGYAKVAKDAPWYSVYNTLTSNTPFDGTPMYSVPDTSNNNDLKNEDTSELEVGLELNMFNNRLGFDVSFYDRETVDLITSVQVSTGSGINFKWVNAGVMTNKGIELGINVFPVKSDNFSWNTKVNWAKNNNEVVKLYEEVENQLIYSAWNLGMNARVGEPYGVLTGYDFVYDADGRKVVGSDGKYIRDISDSNAIIGNIQPDWTGGVSNTLRYKNIRLGFLVDFQKGGDIYNVDMGFGTATGLYAETAGLNDLGNPLRDPVTEDAASGGVILDGVQGTVTYNEDGTYTVTDVTENGVRAYAGNYLTPNGFYGGSSDTGTYAADKTFVYDASYVKLREVTLGYNIPEKLLNRTPFTGINAGVFGRNLWIIHKNLPYGDPEYTASAGNYQGIQNAAIPSVKEYGFNIKFKF